MFCSEHERWRLESYSFESDRISIVATLYHDFESYVVMIFYINHPRHLKQRHHLTTGTNMRIRLFHATKSLVEKRNAEAKQRRKIYSESQIDERLDLEYVQVRLSLPLFFSLSL